MLADKAAKPKDMQPAMKTQLSQSTGTGAFDGQHGIAPVISSIESSVAAAGDI